MNGRLNGEGDIHQVGGGGELKQSIMRDYRREERGAFVDCRTTGRENVSRHPNIFAILFGFVSEKRARRITRTVLENDAVTHITTPYFTFFELWALCRMGKVPLPDGGEVTVRMDAHFCTVTANREGGTLKIKGQSWDIPVGGPFTVRF